MTAQASEKNNAPEIKPAPDIKISIPEFIKELYGLEAFKPQLDISSVKYSNLAYIEASERDVHIDFLEMPGVKKEGRLIVGGTRIYLTYSAARRLAEVLPEILKKAQAGGHIEE